MHKVSLNQLIHTLCASAEEHKADVNILVGDILSVYESSDLLLEEVKRNYSILLTVKDLN